jgi:aspartyl-tRNA(Asn)/glutamyl-tRNA(Gln) amidotransferase subunit A
VEDAALMLGVIVGYDESDPTTTDAGIPDYSRALRMDVSTLRLGIPPAPFFDGVDEEVKKSVDAAIKMLSRRVTSIEDILLPATPLSFDEIYARVRSIEAYAYHSRWIAESPEKYQALTRQRILQNSEKVTAAGYVEARLQVDRLRREIKRTFAKVDLLVTPTMAAPPVLITQGNEPTAASPRNTLPFDILGLPTISVPCGFTNAGLPIGLQISGAPFAESKVLLLAHEYEQATDWHRRHPKLDPA